MKARKKDVDPPKGLLEYMSSPEQMRAAQENAKRMEHERWKKRASGGIEPAYPELMFVGTSSAAKPVFKLAKKAPTLLQKAGKYIVPSLNWAPEAYAAGESSFKKGGVVKEVDPPKGKTTKEGYEYPVYDGRGGRYPSPTKDSSGYYKPVYLQPNQAPKEAQRLKLDTRLTNAALDVVSDLGGSENKLDTTIQEYLRRSRAYAGITATEKKDPNARFSPSPSLNITEGQREFVPKVDKVVDKLSTLSDTDIKELQAQITSLAKPYQSIDKTKSKAEQMAEAISIAAGQDWSGIKPIRGRAGLTKEDVISLLQAPGDANWAESLAYRAARVALDLKDFKNGGKLTR